MYFDSIVNPKTELGKPEEFKELIVRMEDGSFFNELVYKNWKDLPMMIRYRVTLTVMMAGHTFIFNGKYGCW